MIPLFAPDQPAGSVYHEEGVRLYEYAKLWGGPVLEIGCLAGVSSQYILAGLDKKELLVSVDIAPQCAPHGLNHQIIVANSATLERTKLPARDFRWAFIDGDHRYGAVRADIRTCARLCAHPFVLVFHDVMFRGAPAVHREVFQAVVDGYTEDLPRGSLEFIDTPCGLAVYKETNGQTTIA